MAERLDALRTAAATGATADPYAAELHRHGMDQLRREVDWLDGLIETERASRPRRTHRTLAPSTNPVTVTTKESP
jgi:hypothetical protein